MKPKSTPAIEHIGNQLASLAHNRATGFYAVHVLLVNGNVQNMFDTLEPSTIASAMAAIENGSDDCPECNK